MAMMLGAETSQLESLAGQLGHTRDGIVEVQSATLSTSQEVVAEMHETFGRALQGVDASMQRLRAVVDTAHGQLMDTTWTGGNADTFHSGYGEFNTAMAQFEEAVRAAYAGFDAQMRGIGDTIDAFQEQVTASMSQAQGSAESMQMAVTRQRENLEAAMNGSLTFGAV